MRESSDTPLGGAPVEAATVARAAAMSDSCPVQWAGRRAIVTFPQLVGESDASQIREQLLLVINRGATELIADMTGTVSCDRAGAAAVARAYQRAAASGTQLRLAVTSEAVRRVLVGKRLDWLIPIYSSLEAATAAAAPKAVPVRPQPDIQYAARAREPVGSAERSDLRVGR